MMRHLVLLCLVALGTSTVCVQGAGSELTPEQQLLLAAAEGEIETITHLLEENASLDVNHADDDGWTALHFAALEGHDAIVKLLIKNNAPPTKLKQWYYGEQAVDVENTDESEHELTNDELNQELASIEPLVHSFQTAWPLPRER